MESVADADQGPAGRDELAQCRAETDGEVSASMASGAERHRRSEPSATAASVLEHIGASTRGPDTKSSAPASRVRVPRDVALVPGPRDDRLGR